MKRLLKSLYKWYLKKALGEFGKSSWISPFGTYLSKKKIFVGKEVYIGKGAFLSANAGLYIGNGVTIGPEFMVMAGDHRFDIVGKRFHEMTTGGINQPVIIEDDVWVGARVTILKGVKVGEGAIIGAGAIVTKDVIPYTVCAGNPAKRIGFRYSKDLLGLHLTAVGSKYTYDDLSYIYE